MNVRLFLVKYMLRRLLPITFREYLKLPEGQFGCSEAEPGIRCYVQFNLRILRLEKAIVLGLYNGVGALFHIQ